MKTKNSVIYSMLIGFIGGLLLAVSSIGFAQTPPQKNPLPLKDVKRFTNAISQIKNYYVEPISDGELFENAIRGMLNGLDPHSTYLDMEDFKALTSTTHGEFGGLGMEVTMEKGMIKVITPIDDTPAQKAGVKSGDLIIRLNDTPIKGMTLREAVNMMRGKKGTTVNLTILREGEQKPLMITVTRDVIKIKSVKYKMLESGYGYIRLSHFQVPSAENLIKAVKLLQTQAGGHLKGLILDLRNNPGGLLDSAIEISDAFLDSKNLGTNKMIVYTQGRIPGSHFEAKATPGDVINGIPLVIIINQGSASGAEIVAGALQDHKRAILVGTTSFGKGSVQTVLPLDDMTGLKLTTALYYTPFGRSIQAKGIKPDIIIKQVEIKKPDKKSIKALKEAHLRGHLGAKKTPDASKATSKDEEKSLVYEDYTLYEALNVLKGLVIIQVQKAS